MMDLHEATQGRPPSARTLMGYRKLAKRATWSKMHDEINKTLNSIRRNYTLRQTDDHLGMNEASKLYLFGGLDIPPAIFDPLGCIFPFSKFQLF